MFYKERGARAHTHSHTDTAKFFLPLLLVAFMSTIFVSCFQDEVPIESVELQHQVSTEELMQALQDFEKTLRPSNFEESRHLYEKLYPDYFARLESQSRNFTLCDLDISTSNTSCQGIAPVTTVISVSQCDISVTYGGQVCVTSGAASVQFDIISWNPISSSCSNPAVLFAYDINISPNNAQGHSRAVNAVYATILSRLELEWLATLSGSNFPDITFQSIIPKKCWVICDNSLAVCGESCCLRSRTAFLQSDGTYDLVDPQSSPSIGCEVTNGCNQPECPFPSNCVSVNSILIF